MKKNKDEWERFLMNLFFSYAWKKRPKYCECGCGKVLPKDFTTAVLDHTLPKAENEYPECKYSISNIKYYTIDCHKRKTDGYSNDIQKEHFRKALENYDLIVEESSIFVDRVRKKLKMEENELHNKE